MNRDGWQGQPEIKREKQEEISLQWDSMENELHRDAFWGFLTNKKQHNYQTRMDLLLELLAKRSRIIKPRFTVEAIHVRMANVKYETSTEYLESFCTSLGVKLHVVTTSFDETIPTHKPKCFLCSWHRRKQMFNLAQQLGCNKIALGHHNDDIIHTALMNTIFQGHFSTMPVVLHMRKMPITIIRPLCYCEEKDIREYAIEAGYQKQVKLCPYETDSHRTTIRNLYAQIEQMAPEARYSIWNALEAEGKLVEN